MKITIVSPNLSGCPSILDIGLTCLATYINERSEHEARILDFTFHKKGWKKHLSKHLKKYKPDIIGFGTPSMYVDYIEQMIKEIHSVYDQNIPIICGGYHPTLSPDKTLGMKGVTAVCFGDGEETLKEYLDKLKDKKSLKGVKGIWYKEKGKIIKNQLRPKIQNIEDLPYPDYNLWEDLDKYFFFLNQLYVIGMRGCPFNCTNCADQPFYTTTPGNRIRIFSPKRYVAEIKYLYDQHKGKFEIVHCYDPVFTFDKKWLKEFCDEYKRVGLAEKLPFSVFARGDTIDEEIVKMLVGANCKIVRIGIEVGNEKIRIEMLHKSITNEKMTSTVKLLHKYGIVITAFNMLGCPGETKKNLQETFDYIKFLNIDRPVFFIFRPFAGTEALGMMEGSTVDSKKMEDVTSLHKGAVLSLKDMTKKQIERFQLKCYFYFYSKRIWRLVKITKHRFFIDWVKYLIKGFRCGVPLFYIMGYFLHNHGKNGVN